MGRIDLIRRGSDDALVVKSLPKIGYKALFLAFFCKNFPCSGLHEILRGAYFFFAAGLFGKVLMSTLRGAKKKIEKN